MYKFMQFYNVFIYCIYLKRIVLTSIYLPAIDTEEILSLANYDWGPIKASYSDLSTHYSKPIFQKQKCFREPAYH